MNVYADTSALAKLLLEEPGSERMREVHQAADSISSASIAYVELRAVLAAAQRDGRIPPAQRTVVRAELEALWLRIGEVAIDRVLLLAAADFAESQALRGYDAVHLAGLTRLAVSADIAFACWDKDLRAAAQRLGYALIPE